MKTCTYGGCCRDVFGLNSFLTCAFKSSSNIPAEGMDRHTLWLDSLYTLVTRQPDCWRPSKCTFSLLREEKKQRKKSHPVFCLLSSKLVLILSLFVRQPEGGGEKWVVVVVVVGGRTNSFLRNHSASNVLFGSQVREERGTNRTWLFRCNTLLQLFNRDPTCSGESG